MTPDGKMLVGLMQGPLLQDHALNPKGTRAGRYSRLVTMNLGDRSVHENVYLMEDARVGLNEILAINNHEFLVIERDGKSGTDAETKKIYRVDLEGATDISVPVFSNGKRLDYTGTTASNGLPMSGPINGVRTVAKRLFLDLLDPGLGLRGGTISGETGGIGLGT